MNTYSFLTCHGSLIGPGVVASFGAGSAAAEEGVSFKYKDDANKMTHGADGAFTHSLSGAKPGEMIIRLLKTSPLNEVLSNAYNFQRNNPVAHGRNVINFSDTMRGDINSGIGVAFRKFPDNAYADKANIIEWEFDIGLLDCSLGGG